MARNKPKRKSRSHRQSKRQQTELLKRQSNLTYSEINKLSKSELEKVTNISISNQPEKIKLNEIEKSYKQATGAKPNVKAPKMTKKDYRPLKVKAIRNLGFEPYDFTLKEIDSIKIDDIRKGKVNADKYPFLFRFDFYKPYPLPNGKRMYFAYRDYAGETPLEELISIVQGKSTDTLIAELNNIVNMPMTAVAGVKGTSSGKAGVISYHCQQQNFITDFIYTDKKVTRKDKRYNAKRQKETTFAGFQTLKNGRLNSFDIITGRGVLEIAVALMYNATEQSRADFYSAFYYDVIEAIPEMQRFMPVPKY